MSIIPRTSFWKLTMNNKIQTKYINFSIILWICFWVLGKYYVKWSVITSYSYCEKDLWILKNKIKQNILQRDYCQSPDGHTRDFIWVWTGIISVLYIILWEYAKTFEHLDNNAVIREVYIKKLTVRSLIIVIATVRKF